MGSKSPRRLKLQKKKSNVPQFGEVSLISFAVIATTPSGQVRVPPSTPSAQPAGPAPAGVRPRGGPEPGLPRTAAPGTRRTTAHAWPPCLARAEPPTVSPTRDNYAAVRRLSRDVLTYSPESGSQVFPAGRGRYRSQTAECGREGGAAQREAQGARSRGRRRETAGGAHARAGARGGGRGRRKLAGRGRAGAGLEAGRGRGQGRASTPGGGAGRGGDALAGWGRRGRGGGGSVPGFRPCFPLSFHLRPAGAVDRLRWPVPRSRPAAAASFLRSR